MSSAAVAGSRRHTGPRFFERQRTELVLGTATLALLAFYYLARADLVGTYSRGGWRAVTEPPLPVTLHYLMAGLLLGAIPALLTMWLGGLRPADLGLGAGRTRPGLLVLASGLPLVAVAALIGARSPVMQAVYPLDPSVTPDRFAAYAAIQFLYYGGWEVLFRGVVLFGLRDRLGEGTANVIQTALSVLAHFGRPITETFAAVPAGIVFGWIGLRLESIWYVAILHWLLGAGVDALLILR